jgi:hypothetical protein
MQMIAPQRGCAKARIREEVGDFAAYALGHPVDQQGVSVNLWVALNRRRTVAEMTAALLQVLQQPTKEGLHAATSSLLGAHQPAEDARCLGVGC